MMFQKIIPESVMELSKNFFVENDDRDNAIKYFPSIVWFFRDLNSSLETC